MFILYLLLCAFYMFKYQNDPEMLLVVIIGSGFAFTIDALYDIRRKV